MAMDVVIMGQRAFLDPEGKAGLKSDVPRKSLVVMAILC